MVTLLQSKQSDYSSRADYSLCYFAPICIEIKMRKENEKIGFEAPEFLVSFSCPELWLPMRAAAGCIMAVCKILEPLKGGQKKLGDDIVRVRCWRLTRWRIITFPTTRYPANDEDWNGPVLMGNMKTG